MKPTHTNRMGMLVGMSLALLVGLLVPLGMVKAVPVAAEPAAVHRVSLPTVINHQHRSFGVPREPAITLTEGEAAIIAAVNAARVAAGCPAAVHKPALTVEMRHRARRTAETGVFIETGTIDLYQRNYVWGWV